MKNKLGNPIFELNTDSDVDKLLNNVDSLARVKGFNADSIKAEMTEGDFNNLVGTFKTYFSDVAELRL